MGRVLSREEFVRALHREQRRGRRVVFTNGCFDLLHVGHLRAFRAARALGDVLAVAINTDRSVRRLKGPGRPFMPESDRCELVAALEPVDYVTLFDEETPARIIASVVPDVLVKGADYRGREVVGSDVVTRAGGRVALVKLAKGRSTTALARRIASFVEHER